MAALDKKTAVARAKAHGIVTAAGAWDACHRPDSRLEYAIICAILMRETSGGQNVFGHDPTICVGWGTVTEAKYKQYLAYRKRSGNRLMQGVGPMQLTWYTYQDAADKLGGCWVPKNNIAIGCKILISHLNHYGGNLERAFTAYNGSSSYGYAVAHSVRYYWRPLLAGKRVSVRSVEVPETLTKDSALPRSARPQHEVVDLEVAA